MKAYSRAFLFLPLICDSLLLFLPSIHWPWFSYSLLLPPQPSRSPISTAHSPCNRRAWWQGGSPWVRPASQTHRWARSSSDNRSSQALWQAQAQSGSQDPGTASPWSPEATSPHGPTAAGAVKGQRSLLARKHSEPLGGTRIDRLQRHVEATG